ncbi:MAG: hypothetical protein JWO58_1926 [Chitinophagaceae bacterium]|nr:hypothetical protein [Chitinophagaceae bacterium]
MKASVNYIKHFNGVMERFYEDERLSPAHIALYTALFQVWNRLHFMNPLHIVREEIMQAAKIRSNSTYIRCMRELNDWEYIHYKTSHNPARGTRVEFYNFDHSVCKSDCTTSVTAAVTVPVTLPYTNDNKHKQGVNSSAPSLEEVKIFFKEEKFPPKEAEKFFHHYEIKEWNCGKTYIKNWRAAARKWMLNTQFISHGNDTKNHTTTPSAGRLHSSNDKNYSEPL